MREHLLADRRVVERAWPIVIVQDRYGGAYSGGAWLAIAKGDEMAVETFGASRVMCCLKAGPHGSDTDAMAFWLFPPEWIAAGATPNEATMALIEKLSATPGGGDA
jgi:hypothetical protein